MTRYVRNTAVLLELEGVYGTDPTPTAGADALLVSNLSYPEFAANNVDRENVKPHFGSNEELVGTKFQRCSFDLELAGSGTAGTAPAWGKALQACGFAETLVALTYAEYAPVTEGQASATIYWYDSGVLHKFTGARGTVQLLLNVGERPVLRFTFTGLYNTLTAVAVPAVTLTGWQTPLVITDGNTADVKFGGTYADGAVTGGTAFVSTGVEFDVGGVVSFVPFVGREVVEITDRQASLSLALELTAAQEVTAMADVIANTTQSVSIEHGTTAGNIVLIHAPKVQRTNPAKGDVDGIRLIEFDGRVIPDAGNDELVIVAK